MIRSNVSSEVIVLKTGRKMLPNAEVKFLGNNATA